MPSLTNQKSSLKISDRKVKTKDFVCACALVKKEEKKKKKKKMKKKKKLL